MRETGITTRWVNSDRQIADVLTKPHEASHNLQALQSTGRWKIVFDDQFTSAKKLRKAARDENLKRNTQNAQQRALQRSIGQPQWKRPSSTTTTTSPSSTTTTTPSTSHSPTTTRRITINDRPQIRTYHIHSQP